MGEFLIKKHFLDYKELTLIPGGTVAKNLPANAGDAGVIPRSGRSSGEGNGNPLQYSCLENHLDTGGWWATVHGVTKNRRQLSMHSYNLKLEISLKHRKIIAEQLETGWAKLPKGLIKTHNTLGVHKKKCLWKAIGEMEYDMCRWHGVSASDVWVHLIPFWFEEVRVLREKRFLFS